jgi:predicted enzyme related to lactoylglutathione lyase
MSTHATNDAIDSKPRPGKFVWFEHASSDAKKAQAFYEEVLGWKVHRWNDSDTAYDMILAGETTDISTMIGGYSALESNREKPHWISYVSVDDVDAAAKAAQTNGGKVLEAPHDVPYAGRMARIADPQGAELYLFKKEGGDPPDGPMSEPPPRRRFFWCELHTTEPEKAVSFYEKVVGFTHKTMDMGPAGAYHILERGGVGRGGVSGHLKGAAPHWLPYVSVDDPDATIARAKKLGAKIHVEPHDIPGVGRFAVLEDPTGAVLAIMKALPPSGAS